MTETIDIPKYGPGSNTGHGHVWPRPDGLVARCGGPALCDECLGDKFRIAHDADCAAKIAEFGKYDTEHGHIVADDLLCDLIEKSYPLTVAAFKKMDKWYA